MYLILQTILIKRQQLKKVFLNELRQAREKFHGDELKDELIKLQQVLDRNPTELFHTDVVLHLLLSFRDIQVSVRYHSRGTTGIPKGYNENMQGGARGIWWSTMEMHEGYTVGMYMWLCVLCACY